MEAVQKASKSNVFSDYRVKLSCAFMGLGQLFCRQYVKGALLALFEIGFILFLVFAGGENLAGLITLGTVEGVPIMGIEGDNSVSMLAWGITTVFLILFFALAYYANVRDCIYTVGEIRKGHRVKNFFESCSTLCNQKFYFLTLMVPLVFVCIFNVMPIVFTALVAFTNYGEVVPPKLVSWTGLQSFKVIFTMSEYIGTMGKILVWNILWAFSSSFLVYFGGLGLALLYNSACLKWKRLWRMFPMFAYAIPSFITLTGFCFMFCDSGPIVGLLKDWGVVSDKFTIISYDSRWSLRLLGLFCCAWIGIPSVMFLATGILSNAGKDMYEAARLDGANAFQQFWYLTLPFVLFATTPVIISTFINQFNNFSIFYFLRPEKAYAPGYFSANSSDLLINWMYNLTVEKRFYSLGSALSLILFAFMAIFSLTAYIASPAYQKEDTYR